MEGSQLSTRSSDDATEERKETGEMFEVHHPGLFAIRRSGQTEVDVGTGRYVPGCPEAWTFERHAQSHGHHHECE